jgi:hypothetical protein
MTLPRGVPGGVRLGVIRAGERSAQELAAHSRSALDRPLAEPAELWVAVARDDAVLVGAFQRGADMAPEWPLVRRGSGGPEVRVAPGTVHIALALAHPGALPRFADEKRIVNRAVRPLLRALAQTGSLAHYFGRDWVSVEHRPVAWVGFAHDAASRRTLFEAFVGVRTPFALGPRASFLGKAAATLESLRERPLEPLERSASTAERLASAVVDAYVAHAGGEARDLAPAEVSAAGAGASDDPRSEPPWAATCEEAIGLVGAGLDARGVLRVGGDLLVSRDALARLEERLAGAAPADVPRVVDETLAAPGVALHGVKSLTSIADVVGRALGAAGSHR